MKHYTGVGSRATPVGIMDLETRIARRMAELGYVLRSGRAQGSDFAFERGCDQAKGQKEIFLPHISFNIGLPVNRMQSAGLVQIGSEDAAEEILRSLVHPSHFRRMGEFALQAHRRNIHQVLGPRIDRPVPSKVLICWAMPKDYYGQPGVAGGTNTAWLAAGKYGVPRYNLFVDEDREKVIHLLSLEEAA